MKKLLLVIAAVAMLLPSCKKINEALDSLDGRLDKLEQEAIPSIDEQIAAINTTLENLDSMDKELKGYIDVLNATASNLQEQINTTNTKIDEVEAALKKELEDSNAENLVQLQTAKAEVLAQLEAAKTELENELAQINATIATLQEKDKELDEKIKDLNDYVNNELTKTTTWVEATFATLEQYNSLVTEIAVIKEQIKATNQSIAALETYLTTKINADIAAAVASLNADIQHKVKEITDAYTDAIKSAKEEITAAYTSAIQTAITTLDNSLKTWVGEQLANYYTIAQIDAMLATMEQEMNGKLEAQKAYLEGLINELSAALTKSIADNKVLIEGLQKDIATLQGTAAEHASRSAQNASTIATNTQNIIDLSKSIYANKEDITTNEKAIADNKALIEANAKLIADNAAAIKALQASPDASVVKNAAKIAENAEDIAQNAALISANAVAINNNAIAIANNAADILQLQQDLASAKAEITEAYKTAINDAITTNNGVIDAKIAAKVETINTRIDNEVAIINASIKTLTDRMNVLEEEMEAIHKLVADFLKEFDEIKETIERILSMIQSVSYVPQYSDGKAVMMVTAGVYDGTVEFDFQLSPKSVVSDIVANWQSILAIKAVYTKTRAVSYVDMPIISCVADGQNGILTIVASGKNLGEEFFKGNQPVNAALFISDGNSEVVSDYVEIVPVNTSGEEIIPANEIWYTSVDGEIVAPNSATAFNSVLLSNTYHGDKGILKFDADVTEIQAEAFKGCANFVSITLPNTVETIGKSAFKECSGLHTISLGENLKGLGSSAFYDCTSLRSINIPNGVTKLEGSTFANCSKMLSVTIPDSITEIEYLTFSNCTSLTRVNISDLSAWCKIGFNTSPTANPLNEGASLYLNEELVSDLVIPSDITEVKNYAFYNCHSLKSVIVHNGVTAIGDAAFYNCEGTLFIDSKVVENDHGYYDNDKRLWMAKFSEMVIGDNVTKIGAYFCKGYGYLTRVTIGNRVSEISGEAFSGCGNLTIATIGNSVTSIGNSVFDMCGLLETINCNAIIPPVVSSLGCSSEVKIFVYDDCVEEYKESWTNYADLIYSNGKNIDSSNTTSINYTTIDNEIINIDSSKSKFITISNTNTNGVGELVVFGKLEKIENNTFENVTTLTNITIPDSVVDIGSSAFYGCSNLTDIVIGNNVTSIGEGAFYDCANLTKVAIGNNVDFIGANAFYGCKNLMSVNISNISSYCKISFANYASNPLCNGAELCLDNNKITNLNIPSDITEIKEYAFYGCSNAMYITIPNGVNRIGNSAFEGCFNLTRIVIPNSVSTIENNVFRGCTGELLINSKIVEQDYSYNNYPKSNGWLCGSLFTKLTIGDNITKIGCYTFHNCSSLTSVTFPNSVINIGSNSFSYCSNLTDINIPDSVIAIGSLAFYNCVSLKSVTIGNSVATIDDRAFCNCSNLVDVYCKATTPPALCYARHQTFNGYTYVYEYTYVFENKSNMKIYVPENTYDSYTSYTSHKVGIYQDNWYKYKSYIMPYKFD